MKKESIKVGEKIFVTLFISIFLSILMISFASSGFSDFFNTITGKATSQNVALNVTIGNVAPIIPFVANIPDQSITENGVTTVQFYFTANDADGTANLDNLGAFANFSRAGEVTRFNNTCSKVGNLNATQANFSCSIGLYYFDGPGSWNISVSINDTNNARAYNVSTTFTLQQTSAFVQGPGTLTFASISPGSTNTTSSNDPLLLNNTGNKNIVANNISINATDLDGETDNSKSIYAGNFTTSIITGSSSECALTTNQTSTMSRGLFTSVNNATLSKGNYSVADGTTGQEQLFFCIRLAGTELTAQSYSTANEGSWTTRVV